MKYINRAIGEFDKRSEMTTNCYHMTEINGLYHFLKLK